MPRQIERLSAKAVQNEKRPGYHADGGGLYLQVGPTGTKSWVFRYMLKGRTVTKTGKSTSREMGLGPYPDISLADARTRAAEGRKFLIDGLDPIEERRARIRRAALEASRRKTFKEIAEEFIQKEKPGWTNPKHEWQWTNTLERFCYPTLGDRPVSEINTQAVRDAIEPIWLEKHETAKRVLGRIHSILAYAITLELHPGPNPARFDKHIEHVLAKVDSKARIKHYPALPFARMYEFMEKLRANKSTSARALELLVLTALRSGPVRLAERREFDLEQAVWFIPAAKMKRKRDHRVPLPPQAVTLVKNVLESHDGPYLFAGHKGKPISDMTMNQLMGRMGYGEFVPHGFRSSFTDWAHERSNHPREVVEMALAHEIGNDTEAAYRRGDLFDKRRHLMAAWAQYCETRPEDAKVISFAPVQAGETVA
ncbi:MAG: tyrosine-type recombinase/integrase [Rhodospirillaceae bacterium]